MNLSSEQFKRGVISWPNRYGLTIRTKTADVGSDNADWSPPYTNQTGSLVESPARPRRGISIEGDVPREFTLPEVRWTYQDNRGIVTKIWTAAGDHPDTRRHVLAHGCSRRLIVHTPHLSWAAGPVIWTRELVIRFTDSFSGMRVHPSLVSTPADDDTSNVEFKVAQDAVYEGRFIEVVATVADVPSHIDIEAALVQAKANAWAALGLVVRNAGVNVLREEVVLDHGIVAMPGRDEETRIDALVIVPETVSEPA